MPGRRHDTAAREVGWLQARREIVALGDSIAVRVAELAELAKLAGSRVCAADIVAQLDVPPFAASAMDGFAVGEPGADASRYRVISAQGAGEEPPVVAAGEACRVMTGGVVPAGAIGVVPRELAVDEGAWVSLSTPSPGAFVRRAGSDVARGDMLVRAGDVLTPALVGVLAAQGLREVTVYPRVRVGVLSTGRELRRPGQALDPGAIYDANGPALLALLAERGAEVIDLGTVDESEEAVRGAVVGAVARCDLVLTSGGVSAGDTDVVQKVLVELGRPGAILRLALKPARPLAYGVIDGVPVLGLPGNPVSALVSTWLVGLGLIDRLAGRSRFGPEVLWLEVDDDLPTPTDGTWHALRCRISARSDGLVAHAPSANDSGRARELALADALALLAPGVAAGRGSRVPVVPLSALRWGRPLDEALLHDTGTVLTAAAVQPPAAGPG